MNRGNNCLPVFFQKNHGKKTHPPQKCAQLFPHRVDLAVMEMKRGSVHHYVWKINEFNYALNVSVVSDSTTKCVYPDGGEQNWGSVFARSEIKLELPPDYCMNWRCHVMSMQKRMGRSSSLIDVGQCIKCD